MKKLLLLLLSLLSLTVFADEKILALLQPLTASGSSACNPIEISMVRGELRNAFGWHSDFQVVTRMDVDAMLKEQGFQNSGLVDDEQRKEVGRMTGAQYICVSTITKYNTQLYIEAYLVDVETGKMTNPASQYINVKNDDYSTLRAQCEELAKGMLGELVSKQTATSSIQDFTETAYGVNMKMIWVEGGEFLMGCTSEQGNNCHDDEENVRRVTVDGFYIGMLEVTQAQWEKVMGTTISQQWTKADNSGSPTRGVGNEYPMYCVSWEEAMEFCRLLSIQTGKTYTLPTEAQWEYAARGGCKNDGTKYAGSHLLDAVGWYADNSGDKTNVVGSKRANALGIYDMSGNVWEWCKDWYASSYSSSDTNNPTGPSSGSSRVNRGGGWGSSASYCRVAYRSCSSPGFRGGNLGFRVVLLP